MMRVILLVAFLMGLSGRVGAEWKYHQETDKLDDSVTALAATLSEEGEAALSVICGPSRSVHALIGFKKQLGEGPLSIKYRIDTNKAVDAEWYGHREFLRPHADDNAQFILTIANGSSLIFRVLNYDYDIPDATFSLKNSREAIRKVLAFCGIKSFAALETSLKPAHAPDSHGTREMQSAPLTVSEIDAIRYQIQQCWSIPAGARDAVNLVVRIKVFLNADGSLSKASEIVGSRGTDDPLHRTAAESARRAVLKCTPLNHLPAENYARWREITLTFNPREMLGE